MAKLQSAEQSNEPDSLNEGSVREFVGYAVKRAYLVLHPLAQSGAEEVGLRIPSFSCLSVIVANPGIAPSVLAEQLKMARPNVVVIIDELEQSDLISRTQMKTDRRRQALSATVRGRRLHDKAVAAIHRSEGRLLQRLNSEEQEQLIALLNKIEVAAED